jgi:hypothetical protein
MAVDRVIMPVALRPMVGPSLTQAKLFVDWFSSYFPNRC